MAATAPTANPNVMDAINNSVNHTNNNTHATAARPIMDNTIYEIQCNKFEISPVVILRDCKIIIISGGPAPTERNIVADFANVKVSAPVTINDRANIQTNPFSTVNNNYQGEPRGIEVSVTEKNNK